MAVCVDLPGPASPHLKIFAGTMLLEFVMQACTLCVQPCLCRMYVFAQTLSLTSMRLAGAQRQASGSLPRPRYEDVLQQSQPATDLELELEELRRKARG